MEHEYEIVTERHEPRLSDEVDMQEFHSEVIGTRYIDRVYSTHGLENW